MPSGGRGPPDRNRGPIDEFDLQLIRFAPRPARPVDRRRRRGSAAAAPSSHPDQFFPNQINLLASSCSTTVFCGSAFAGDLREFTDACPDATRRQWLDAAQRAFPRLQLDDANPVSQNWWKPSICTGLCVFFTMHGLQAYPGYRCRSFCS